MINKFTDFEEGNATRSKELEHYLKSLKEKTEQLSKDWQTLTASRAAAHAYPAAHPFARDSRSPRAAPVSDQLASEVRTSQRSEQMCSFNGTTRYEYTVVQICAYGCTAGTIQLIMKLGIMRGLSCELGNRSLKTIMQVMQCSLCCVWYCYRML